jgi:hypothetical protein
LLLLLEALDPLLGGILLLFVELIVPNCGTKDEGEVVTGNQDGAAENALWTGVSSRTGLVAISVCPLDV